MLAGDYNVIPTAADARNPAAWTKDALFLPQTREKFRALTNLGLTDAIRAVSDARDLYTFWDYQAGAWAKDDGIRIDHLLLSPQAADRLADAGIDRHVRSLGQAVRPRARLRRSRYRGEMTELRAIETDPGLVFDVLVDGPADMPLVLLLHGFAKSFHMWRAQLPALAAAGYRAVAPSQRGYSPGARPSTMISQTITSTSSSATRSPSPTRAGTAAGVSISSVTTGAPVSPGELPTATPTASLR